MQLLDLPVCSPVWRGLVCAVSFGLWMKKVYIGYILDREV